MNWWQHLIGHGIAGPALLFISMGVVDTGEALILFGVWMVAWGLMGAVLWWVTRASGRWNQWAQVTAVAVFLPKCILGSALVLVPSGRMSNEYVYLVGCVAFATAAGTMMTLGPIRRLSSSVMVGLFVPFGASLFWLGHVIIGLGVLAFFAVLVLVALNRLSSWYEELVLLRMEMSDRANEAERAASTDALTGLLNRHGLFTKMDSLAGRPASCFFVDLDRFKAINDTYGHSAGDQVLRTVADRLTAVTRDDEVVVRIGGDEFLVIATDLDTERTTVMAERLRAVLAEPILVELGSGPAATAPCRSVRSPQPEARFRLTVSASIGVTLDETLDHELDEVLWKADRAPYQAKSDGRDRWVISEV